MKKSHANYKVLIPVLFTFFTMGFCDSVGISSNYIQQDFGLSEIETNYLPSMVFVWFFIFSVPVGSLMNRIGRKSTVMISMAFTLIAMLIPLISYTYPSMLLAFALVGIGNTILQVSLNPLLTNVVSDKLLTSSLTAGQFVKAISSFCAPVIAAFAATQFGNWKLMFQFFAGITILSSLWLLLTPIQEDKNTTQGISFFKTFHLLKNKTILFLFLGILFIVGVDVGMNIVSPKLLMERCGLELEDAGYATSLYFIFRTAGTFTGAFLLAKVKPVVFNLISVILATTALVFLIFAQQEWIIYALIATLGFTCANVFSVIFGAALQKLPKKANEISGLMIMGVSGGAILPVLMGYVNEMMHSITGTLLVIGLCLVYLLNMAFSITRKSCI